MRDLHNVDVSLPMRGGRGGRVVIDGTPLRGVRKVAITSAFDDVTEVTVTFLANVNIGKPVEVPAIIDGGD